jgi:hypothetical protein
MVHTIFLEDANGNIWFDTQDGLGFMMAKNSTF